jgi:protein O-GlcNAc transferase
MVGLPGMIWMVLIIRCVGAFIAAATSNNKGFLGRSSLLRAPTTKPSIDSSSPFLLFATVTNTRGGGGNSSDDDVPSAETTTRLDVLLEKAQCHLRERDANQAFATLAEAYGIDPTSTKIALLFESCLELKVLLAEETYYQWKNATTTTTTDHHDGSDNNIALSETELTNLFQDRMGLSSLFIDKEQYDEAGIQLRKAIEEANYWLSRSLQPSADASSSAAATTKMIELSNTRYAHWQPLLDRAQYLLYRSNAACCRWDKYFEDGYRLSQSLSHNLSPSSGHVQRTLHPFDALKFPCISLDLASKIAESYASRALEVHGITGTDNKPNKDTQQQPLRRSVVTVNRKELPKQTEKIRIGYISPDFTSRHPLAFLMQHVFRYHDKSQFSVYIYSLSSNVDNGIEVEAIRESCDQFTCLSPSAMSPLQLYERMLQDELDIIVDLCGYSGTSLVAEIMASRQLLRQMNEKNASDGEGAMNNPLRLPIHASYMGFPGSIGSPLVWDYSIFDQVVIPPSDEFGIRKHYNEALVYMPHCYFVNSHKTVLGNEGDGIVLSNDEERIQMRAKYGIHPMAFVYCCHSRPDKIDPSTFRSWMRALSAVRSEYYAKQSSKDGAPILWLLRSGKEMENNLRELVRSEFGDSLEDVLLFADVSERNEHLRRLGCADVFLDTPAYNAHTLGCDALYLGLPMISLLRKDGNDFNQVQSAIATDKLASRVGASLLHAAMLGDLIYPTMSSYEDAMIQCAVDSEWFNNVKERLRSATQLSPLFDTERWVRNLEASFIHMKSLRGATRDKMLPDIIVEDSS